MLVLATKFKMHDILACNWNLVYTRLWVLYLKPNPRFRPFAICFDCKLHTSKYALLYSLNSINQCWEKLAL